MDEERIKIMQMLADGTITTDFIRKMRQVGA
jgi:hypothetical protein